MLPVIEQTLLLEVSVTTYQRYVLHSEIIDFILPESVLLSVMKPKRENPNIMCMQSINKHSLLC